MKKFTVVDLAEKIKSENEAFEKMTKAEKRVVIAKDCLLRIELEQIVPERNKFCRLAGEYEYSSKSIQETLNTTNKLVCSACAKGSLFMSYIGRVNKTNFTDIDNDNSKRDSDHKKLQEIFTLKQLSLIEYVFEGSQYIYSDNKDKNIIHDSSKMVAFRSKYEYNDELTLKAICENIIKNKGTFKL